MLTVPASQNNPTQDGRVGIGPWSRELGVKIAADEPMQINTVRFYKSSKETGTHVGTIWTTSGFQLAQITFVGETASGWQRTSASDAAPDDTGRHLHRLGQRERVLRSHAERALDPGHRRPTAVDRRRRERRLRVRRGHVPDEHSYRSSNYFVDVSTSPTATRCRRASSRPHRLQSAAGGGADDDGAGDVLASAGAVDASRPRRSP